MSRATRHAGVAVATVVVVSALARFLASLSLHAPWVAPDEMAYGLLGQSLWQTGELTIRGTAVGYYSLIYPALVGAPLSLGSTATGIVALQAVQALLMSAVAVPVFLWGRSLAGAGWGLVAAALSVLPPALAYSGLIMSEALYYPFVAVALLSLAQAVQHPSLFRLGVLATAVSVAAAVRLQALVLVPTFLTAVVLDAVLARDRRKLRRETVSIAAAVSIAMIVLGAVLAAGQDLAWNSLLGGYQTVAGETPGIDDLARALVRSAGGIVLASLVIPFLATAVLAVLAMSRGESDPALRAFLATTIAYVCWLVLQVAVFASSFVAYVPERYLITALPLLFLGLCAWAARRAPRPAAVLVPVAAVSGALVVALSPAQLFADQGAHDLLTLLVFRDLATDAPAAAVRAIMAGSLLVAVTALALPARSRTALLTVGVAAGLAVLSVGSTREISDLSRAEETKAFGTADRDWIDKAAGGEPVMLLNSGDREWTIAPRTAFWNRSVTAIVRFPTAQGSGAIPQGIVEPGADGLLRTPGGAPLRVPLLAAPTSVVPVGEKVAEIPPTPVAAGLALWRIAEPATLSSIAVGLGANGDFAAPVHVIVYACRPGRLELTLLGKSGGEIAIRANGIPREAVAPVPGGLAQVAITAPPNVDGSTSCVFELSPSGLAGSTRIAFVRDAA